jgi:hypothetical protein
MVFPSLVRVSYLLYPQAKLKPRDAYEIHLLTVPEPQIRQIKYSPCNLFNANRNKP